MGLLRPARTVTSSSGDYWELYVSKTALPRWKEGNSPDSGTLHGGEFDVIVLALGFVGFLWSSLLFPLLRFVFLLPFAIVRGRRSRAVRIEAVNSYPERQVLLWTTTDIHVKSVLDEIAAGLATGKVVQPVAAVYSGVQTG